MRGFLSGAYQSIAIAALDIRAAFRRDFDYFYEDKPWRFRGLYLRLPVVDIGLFLEWREVNVGLGWEPTEDGQGGEFFCGRLQGSVSLNERARA